MNTPNAPRTIGEIVATVKGNLANGTAVLGPTHYDKNGAPIDLSGRGAMTSIHNLPEPYGSAYRELIPQETPSDTCVSDTDLPYADIDDDWRDDTDDADTENGDY